MDLEEEVFKIGKQLEKIVTEEGTPGAKNGENIKPTKMTRKEKIDISNP